MKGDIGGNENTEPPIGNKDVYYGGDLNKWQKFANSLALHY
ncbi:SusD/RagB family nutrient-binding outer membrane lipoprotein [Flavihumibacter fluvii]|nr:SusD/RagB family nutrient-binding outer membrane lipoprotein [Flavihumibacter fluvii]ULQ51507.1 SusD/RagB family nutrient-binding outer membrane lipoprotein [Flavihumibacter fluvii]